jgi:hypothetical protein
VTLNTRKRPVNSSRAAPGRYEYGLLDFDAERVTFPWKEYFHRRKQYQMTFATTEFLRRFSLVLPKCFVQICQFRFLEHC